MSTIRACRPRGLRPRLSLRYQRLQRRNSTAANATPTNNHTSTKGGFFRNNRSPLIWSSFALVLGLMSGNLTTQIIAPPTLPAAGTAEDGVLIADLNKRIDEEFKVKVLRGKCLGVAKQLKGAEVTRVEIVPGPEEDVGTRRNELTSQMQGAKGVGVERLFWDGGEKKLVAVVWFGSALSGWPGVTHGGMIATALAEKFALAAALAEGRGKTISAAAVPQRMPGVGNHAKMFAPSAKPDEPAQLSLSYVKPTHANDFYVIRISPAIELDQDPAQTVRREAEGGDEYEATLETLDARICVKAKARFHHRGLIPRFESPPVNTATPSYAEFKDWLWPSRQKASQH